MASDEQRRILELQRSMQGFHIDPLVFGQHPLSLSGSGYITTSTSRKKPVVDEKRRLDPEKIQYMDLKKSDIVEGGTYGPYEISAIDDDEVHFIDCEGDSGKWDRNNETLASFGRRLKPVAPPKPKVKFDDVILPANDKEAILDAIKQVDNHKLIFEDWGFGEVLEKGKAISMLFYGPPGTGKTLMAQAVADRFNYKLKVIGSAEIESSEPGQAERNIKAFFDAANKDKDMVLLFDECDSLIADRRGVGMILGAQINALLTNLENFEGIAIFTTNRLEKMDEAFNRRLSLKLEFNMPDAIHRAKIWQRMFPKKAPLSKDVNFEALASVEIAGGYIKNVVLRAARRAANTKRRVITQKILIEALTNEVERMTEFEEAVNSNTTPRMMGGDYSVRKG